MFCPLLCSVLLMLDCFNEHCSNTVNATFVIVLMTIVVFNVNMTHRSYNRMNLMTLLTDRTIE